MEKLANMRILDLFFFCKVPCIDRSRVLAPHLLGERGEGERGCGAQWHSVGPLVRKRCRSFEFINLQQILETNYFAGMKFPNEEEPLSW